MNGDRPVALSFAVSHDTPLGVDGCPHGTLPAAVETSVQTFHPVVPEAYVTADRPIRTPPALHTENGPDGVPKPKVEKSLLQRYWYYIIPIVVLLMLPGAEDVGDPMRPPNTGTRQVAQGAGARQVAQGAGARRAQT